MKNEKNENQRSLENQILVEWFTCVIEGIAEDEKANANIVKKYIKEVEKYKGLDFFKVQAIVDDFIEEIKK